MLLGVLVAQSILAAGLLYTVFWAGQTVSDDPALVAAYWGGLSLPAILLVATILFSGVMAEALGVPAATLSFHLKELVHAGLATQERSGRNIVYRAAYDRMNAVLGYLTAHCCQGAECLDPAAAGCTTC